MKRVYLFVYSDILGNRETVKRILDNIPKVLKWRYDMPNSFYLLSESTANELVDLIHNQLENRTCRFIIVEITKNHQGYLPEDSWQFINMD